jgi:hypothetical protein
MKKPEPKVRPGGGILIPNTGYEYFNRLSLFWGWQKQELVNNKNIERIIFICWLY